MKDPTSKQADYLNLVSEADLRKLLTALAVKRGDAGFEEIEGEKLIRWAQWTAFQSHMLQLAIKGMVLPDIQSKDPLDFKDMTFQSVISVLGPSGLTGYQKLLQGAADLTPVEELLKPDEETNAKR